jgi:hypothetical protein
MALRRDDLVPGIPLGDRGNAHVVDLLSRADLETVAAGTVCFLVVLNHYMRALAGTVAHLATSTEEMR